MEWNTEENFSMEWNMEENFGKEWNMEWKIFGMEWKWNGRKLPVWNMEKSSSIPFHTMPWRLVITLHVMFGIFTIRPNCNISLTLL